MGAFLGSGLLAVLACLLGAARDDARSARVWALAVGALSVLVVLVWALSNRGRGVSDADYVEGVALAVLLAVAFVAVGFGLGRAARRHRAIVAVACVVMVAASLPYTFFGALAVLELVNCGPDAYECPL